MDVMEPVVEDREDLLRNEVIQLFGKYYRNVRQMTPEQRVAYRSQLSSLFARANEKLRNYVNLIVIMEPHLKLEDVNRLIAENPQMGENIRKFVTSEDFNGLDDYLYNLNSQGSIIRIEREVRENAS